MLTRINYQNDTYSPFLHSNFILNKIIEFNAVESNLILSDAASLVSGLGTAAFMIMNSAGFFYYLALGAAFYFGRDPVLGRNQYRKQFLDKLTELLELYDWCCRMGGEHNTYDDAFLVLLDTIAPYVQDGKKLVLTDRECSPQFKQILSQAPQYLQFLEDRKVETASLTSIVGSLFAKPKPKPASSFKPKETLEWIASFKWRFYREEKPADAKMNENTLAEAVTTATSIVGPYLRKIS